MGAGNNLKNKIEIPSQFENELGLEGFLLIRELVEEEEWGAICHPDTFLFISASFLTDDF